MKKKNKILQIPIYIYLYTLHTFLSLYNIVLSLIKLNSTAFNWVEKGIHTHIVRYIISYRNVCVYDVYLFYYLVLLYIGNKQKSILLHNILYFIKNLTKAVYT